MAFRRKSAFVSHLLTLVVVLVVGCAPPAKFENEVGFYTPPSESGAVAPSGYRRTKDGWEDASQWYFGSYQSRSIEHWVETQENREPMWLRKTLGRIRTIPPLMIALIQVTAIAGIVHISRVDQRQSQ